MAKIPDIKEVKPGIFVREKDMELLERLGGASVRKLIGDREMRNAGHVLNEYQDVYPDEAKNEVLALLAAYESFADNLDKDSNIFIDFMNNTINLKSMSAMFGYPLATTISHSLYNFCEREELNTQKSQELIRIHIATLMRIFEDRIKDDGGDVGREIVKQFRALTS